MIHTPIKNDSLYRFRPTALVSTGHEKSWPVLTARFFDDNCGNGNFIQIQAPVAQNEPGIVLSTVDKNLCDEVRACLKFSRWATDGQFYFSLR